MRKYNIKKVKATIFFKRIKKESILKNPATILKHLFFFVLTIVVFVLVADYILQHEYDLIGEITHFIFGGEGPEKPGTVEKIKISAPLKKIKNPVHGRWSKDQDKAKIMVPIYKSKTKGYKLSKPVDMAVNPDGSTFIVDRSYGRHVELAPDGSFRRYFYLRQASQSKFEYPDLIAFKNNKIYTIDDKKTIFVHLYQGKEKNRFTINYQAYDLTVDNLGNVYILAPTDSFRIHKYNPKGREILAFSPQEEKDAGTWSILSRGHIDSDENGNIYYALETPYKILKYSPKGQPLLSFSRALHIRETPPSIHRRGNKVVAINRQQYSYDLKVSKNNIVMNLNKSQGINGGDAIDLFTTDGEYLQSIHLSRNYLHLGAITFDNFMLQLPRPINTVERYKMEFLIGK